MIKLITRSFFLLSVLFITPDLHAVTTPNTEGINSIQTVLNKLASMKVKDIQKLTGRKLTLKEKISFWLLKQQIKNGKAEKSISKSFSYKQNQYKNEPKRKSRKGDGSVSKGQTAFVFGIVAVTLLLISLFVPYVLIGSFVAAILAIVLGTIAKNDNPSDGKAKVGKLLGWITLGLLAFLFFLAAIVLSNIFD